MMMPRRRERRSDPREQYDENQRNDMRAFQFSNSPMKIRMTPPYVD
jgi:hypothetical protein